MTRASAIAVPNSLRLRVRMLAPPGLQTNRVIE